MNTLGERFKDFRESLGETQQAMAERLWVTRGFISSVEIGRVGVSVDILGKLHTFGADLNWLLTGSGQFLSPSGKAVDDAQFVQIPLLPQKVSAGAGQEFVAEITTKFGSDMTVPAPMRWGKDCKAVEVRGDSMTGVNIFDGDIVYFRPGEIRGDGLYIIQVNGEVLVKRLEFNHFEQKIRISSENPKYPDRLESSNSQAMTILGKVRGWLHEHPY